MDYAKIKKLFVEDEGKVLHAYKDSRGLWTIGIGHLIDQRAGGGITEEICDFIFKSDIEEKTAGLDAYLPWWRELDEVRQLVLLSMCFNLGIRKLLKFKITLGHIKEGKYALAAREMLQSKPWADQVPNRVKKLSKMMRTGIYE